MTASSLDVGRPPGATAPPQHPDDGEYCSQLGAALNQTLKLAAHGHQSQCLEALGIGWLERLQAAPELLFKATRKWLKQDQSRRAALVDVDCLGQSMTCFYKESSTRSWWVRLVVHLGAFRAQNAWIQGIRLRQAGIATPLPLAVSTSTRSGTFFEYLLTESIAEATNLQDWLRCWIVHQSRQNATQRQEVIVELARQLRNLHFHGFDHRDLKPTNILISEFRRSPSVWLIDLDGVWRWPWMPHSRRVQNLSRLWAGLSRLQCMRATEVLLFLKTYLGPNWRGGWKRLWRQVERRAGRKLNQAQRYPRA